MIATVKTLLESFGVEEDRGKPPLPAMHLSLHVRLSVAQDREVDLSLGVVAVSLQKPFPIGINSNAQRLVSH